MVEASTRQCQTMAGDVDQLRDAEPEVREIAGRCSEQGRNIQQLDPRAECQGGQDQDRCCSHLARCPHGLRSRCHGEDPARPSSRFIEQMSPSSRHGHQGGHGLRGGSAHQTCALQGPFPRERGDGSDEPRIVNLGSVPGCLRKLGREPRHLRVRWDAGADAYDHGDSSPEVFRSDCAACPVQDWIQFAMTHSIVTSSSCLFDFSARANAMWVAGVCLLQDFTDVMDDIVSQFALFEPATLAATPSVVPDPMHCSSMEEHFDLSQQTASIRHLYQLLQERGLVADPDDGPFLHLVTWYLHGDVHPFCLQPSRIRLDRWYHHWSSDLRALWADHADVHVPLDLHVVHPEPPDVAQWTGSIHLILTQQNPAEARAVLCCTVLNDPVPSLHFSACFASLQVRHPDLVDLFQIGHLCEHRDCLFKTDAAWLTHDSDEVVPVRHGMCLLGHVQSTVLMSLDPDATSLMQTFANDPLDQDSLRLNQLYPRWEQPIPDAAPADQQDDSDEDLPQDHSEDPEDASDYDLDHLLESDASDGQEVTHLYRLTRRHCRVRFTSQDVDEMLLSSAEAWNLDPQVVHALHRVPSSSMEGPTFITELNDDRPPASPDKMLLVDVIFHYNSPRTPARRDRRIRILPAFLCRFRLLYLNHVSHHCMLEQDRCLVYVNDTPWGIGGPEFWRFQDGNHIILVPPSHTSDNTAHLTWTRQKRIHPSLVTEDEIGSCSDVDAMSCHDQASDADDSQLLQLSHEPSWIWPAFSEPADALDFMPGSTEGSVFDAPLGSPRPPLRSQLDSDLRAQLLPFWNGRAPRAIHVTSQGELLLRVRTWYVDHARPDLRLLSRDVWLTPISTSWLRTIVGLWEDVVDFAATYDALVVTPSPRPQTAAVVLSLEAHGSVRESSQVGLSLPCPLHRRDLSAIFGLPDHACRLYFASAEITNHYALQALDGEHYTLIYDTTLLTEEVSLMQRNIGLPGLPVPPPDENPALAAVPFFTQFLHLAWNQGATCAPGETERHAVVLTWFLDFNTMPRCHHPRAVTLYEDVQTWEQSIERAWEDLLDRTEPIDLYQVLPAPPDTQPPAFAHVIVCQRAHVHKRAVLATAYTRGGYLHRAAGLVDAQTDEAGVQRVVGLEMECTYGHLRDLCTCFLGSVQFSPSTQLAAVNGMRLHLLVDAPDIYPPELEADPDGPPHLELLQIDTHLRRQQSVGPTTLCLNDLVPSQSMMVPCGRVQFLRQQLLHLDLGPIWPRSSVVKWHESTQTQFDMVADWMHEPPIMLHFFTDGTSCKVDGTRQGASAVVLVVTTSAGDRFGGFRCYADDDVATAPRAELSAMLVAVLWAAELLQLFACHGHVLPVAFHYDCLLAGHCANGTWGASANLDIALPLRALVQWLVQRFSDIFQWHHVQAHTGHPWNEAADAVAWASLNQWIPCVSLRPVLNIMTFDGTDSRSVEWLWFLEAALQGHPAVPPVVGDAFALGQPPDPAIHSLVRSPCQPVTSLEETPFILKCVTANVLTLYGSRTDKDAYTTGSYVSARQEALLQMCHDNGYHIVGIQESRSKMHGYFASEHYHILSSPATSKGVGGVQLWISKSWTTTQGGVCAVTPAHLKIVHQTSQRMLVRFHCNNLRFVILVAHAPNNVATDALRSWWTMCTQAVPNSLRDWPMIALLDANARVGSLSSHAIGSCHAEQENDAGQVWHQWLVDSDLVVPQTFDHFHHGPISHTWIHPANTSSARLDYVAISQSLASGNSIRTCLADFDITLQRQDHLAVLLELPLCLRTKVAAAPAAPLAPLPLTFDWGTDVRTHAASLQDVLKRLTSRPRAALKPHRKHMSEATWQLVLAKKYHWRRRRSLLQTLRRGSLRAVFQAWAHGQASHECSPWLRLAHHASAFHEARLDSLAKCVTASLRQDDKQYYETLAFQTGQSADLGLHGLWKNVKAVLPKNRQKRQSRLTCVGPDPDDMAQHYCDLEAGERVTYDRLLADCFHRQCEAAAEAPVVASLDSFPTRLELESTCRRTKNGKAPGIDGLRSEEIKESISCSSAWIHFLFFKAWALGAEPLQFKGGLIWSIAKRPGALNLDGLRGIMLLEVLGKLFHALLRRRLLDWTLPPKLVTQFGGYRGQQIAFPSLMLRSFLHHAEKHHVSTAVLFIDIRSAFHCMLRQIVFGTSATISGRLEALLENEGFDVAVLQEGWRRRPPSSNRLPLPCWSALQLMLTVRPGLLAQGSHLLPALRPIVARDQGHPWRT